jgi:hypothetical protein
MTEAKHPSPPLVALGIVFTVLSIASILVVVLVHGPSFPSPYASGTEIESYFTANPDAVRLSAFLRFGAAIPFALFAAVAVSRLQFLGVRAAGVMIALAGGFLGAGFLALSGLLGWVLARPDVLAQPALIRLLHDLVFMTGGVGHVVPLGLFLAGVSVTSGFLRLLPRWLVVLGIVLAVLAELSTFVLIFPAAAFLLPAVRIPGFIWMIAAGALLPRSARATT